METLFEAFSELTGKSLVLKGESLLEGRLGKPDYAVHTNVTPIGYMELKAPGKGADPTRYSGHDRKQWETFQNVPNLLYTDGENWALYRDGLRISSSVHLDVRLTESRPGLASREAAEALFDLLAEFVNWNPVVPHKAPELASFLAPYCRLLRSEVMEALDDPASPMHRLKKELKALLFPEASDFQFADAYAQTVLFALLLARMDDANTLLLADACEKLEQHGHTLLSRSLQFLTDSSVRKEIETALDMLRRVISVIPQADLRAAPGQDDPWLFFYEHFLAAYDPALRKDMGAYYTPMEVVRSQVRLVDEILVQEFGKLAGFLEASVITLDPAVGTGTYLLGVLDHALQRIEREEGKGAVRGGARSLAANLHGFEWLVGPYAVAQLRLSQALISRGAALPSDGPGIYLTNTLESPHTIPPTPTLFHEPIAEEHERALRIKDKRAVIVTLGNPPYDRHAAAKPGNRAVTGGWVRYGDKDTRPVLEDFLEPARKAGHGGDLKNLYNLYIYFIRWALWKTFEHQLSTDHGVVTFITASSYLDGDAFVGVRRYMRKLCDHIDIIDLGGEGRGARKEENVFAIQTPVCIFIAWRKRKKTLNRPVPAKVRYVRIEGTRSEKLAILDKIYSRKDLDWRPVPDEWEAPFTPEGKGEFFTWPLLTDLMPWQNNGVKAGRTWVIAPQEECLTKRIDYLLKAPDNAQAKLFKDSPTGRKWGDTPNYLPPSVGTHTSLASAKADEVQIYRYGYRSFDRQYLVADARVLDRPARQFWFAQSDHQIYFTTSIKKVLGSGPAITASALLPDLDYFCNRGAKDTAPLFRDPNGLEPNFSEAVLNLLATRFQVKRDDLVLELAGYIYALLAQPAYTERFATELLRKEIRVPLTRDIKLFKKVAAFGRRLLWIHTYGERFADPAEKRPKGQIHHGNARCQVAVPDTREDYPETFQWNEENNLLHVGKGVFGPVSREVFEFDVSGLKVVQSWLGYRMKARKGKKSSLLDHIGPEKWTRNFTTEFLHLLWVLEATVDGYSDQSKLLDQVVSGPMFLNAELPPVRDSERKPPHCSNGEDIDAGIAMPEIQE